MPEFLPIASDMLPEFFFIFWINPEALEERGGRWGIRTHDPLIKSQLLYQLS
jgi:hypothetical protein